ncbi:MAG TPA: hypothetical protein VN496_14775 [Burkholderiales bacterium]|nr:hypothetical protein [Burkholderiales bacterium]
MGRLMDWNDIVKQNAGSVPHFGEPREQYAAARSNSIVTPLRQFELLRFHGSDAKAFLQGQLTIDLDEVTSEQAQFGGYCNPKGRLIANFLLFVASSGYLMQVPREVAGDLATRLRKYVLRSQVSIEHERGQELLGLAGPQAVTLLEEKQSAPPSRRMAVGIRAHRSVIRLPGNQFVVVAASRDMSALWDELAERAVPAGEQCWAWLQIEAGIPWITQATREQFLPQMVRLDEIGGVSFNKGCFPGQEIVARTRYLGDVKRKLKLGHTRGEVQSGDALFSADQQTGTVLNAAPVPDAGCALLAVVSQPDTGQTRTADGESIVWSEAFQPD